MNRPNHRLSASLAFALIFLVSADMAVAGMDEMGAMNGTDSMTSPMSSGMNSGNMAMGTGCTECMGMMGKMGTMKGMSAMAGSGVNMQSNLPGFPGASHLYHIGADGFFVNHHPQHIELSLEQQTQLNQQKQKALLDQATAEREIEAAEQALFVLTGAEQPDAKKIEAQLRAIEERRVQQRMAYIRAVGEAAQVLTDAQRSALLGTASGGAKAAPGH